MVVSSYRDLLVWKAAMELAKIVYAVSAQFPAKETYGITSQLQRAATSVPANIAEGHAQTPTKEFLHHLSIARGSLAELETLLTLAEQLGYCGQSQTLEVFPQCDRVSRMLAGLRKRLKEKIERIR